MAAAGPAHVPCAWATRGDRCARRPGAIGAATADPARCGQAQARLYAAGAWRVAGVRWAGWRVRAGVRIWADRAMRSDCHVERSETSRRMALRPLEMFHFVQHDIDFHS